MPKVARGRVQDGAAVLDNDERLPGGQEVTVMTRGTGSNSEQMGSSRSHSVLDIVTLSLVSVLDALAFDNDLLGEMLEGRP